MMEIVDSTGTAILVDSTGTNITIFKKQAVTGITFTNSITDMGLYGGSSQDAQDMNLYYNATIGVRLWDTALVDKPLFAIAPTNSNRYINVATQTEDIEVFSSLPSTSGYPLNLVIKVGSTFYRNVSGTWTSISSGAVTAADKAKYVNLLVYLSFIVGDPVDGSGHQYPANGITIYVLGFSNTVTASGAGLEIYSASGVLTFSSFNKYPKLVAAFNSFFTQLNTSATIASMFTPQPLMTVPSYSSSKIYAIVQSSRVYSYFNSKSGLDWICVPGVRVSSTGVVQLNGMTQSVSAGGSGLSDLDGTGLVFDVTGF